VNPTQDPRYGYQQPPGYPQPPAPPTGPVARPTVLSAGIVAALGAALLTIVAQVLALSGGRDALAAAVKKELGITIDPGGLLGPALDEAYSTIQSRAYAGIVVAVIVAVLALVARNGSTGGRVALAILLAIGALLMIRSVTDAFPGGAKAIGTVAIILAPIAIVLVFLPAVNQYKAARAAR
jgi:hypothetical protein